MIRAKASLIEFMMRNPKSVLRIFRNGRTSRVYTGEYPVDQVNGLPVHGVAVNAAKRAKVLEKRKVGLGVTEYKLAIRKPCDSTLVEGTASSTNSRGPT